jgi:hypothetical protein
MTIAINLIAFKIGWLASVLGGANGLPWLGTIVALGVVTLHLSRAIRPGAELRLVIAAGLLGATWDSLLATTGWLSYTSGTLFAGTAPYWIVAMWLAFSTTLNVSLTWLKGHLWLAAVVGAISGPLAFYAGHKLGAVQFENTAMALGALAGGWAVIMPLLVVLATRFDGYSERGLMHGAGKLARSAR